MGQLEDMSLFVRIIDTGSITATAEQLGLAKSAVSRRLMTLENGLGVQLLNRTTRKSSLTEAGLIYYQQAQGILANVDDLKNAVTEKNTELKGVLKIAVPLSFGLLHLSPAVNEFANLHPDLVIDIHFADRQVDLIEEGIDLTIRIANLSDSSLIARRLSTIGHMLCASPAYLLKHGVPKTPEDLKSHHILRYKSPSGISHQMTDNEGNSFDISGKTVMTANNGDFLKQAALNGRGIYLCPTFINWRDIQAGLLVPILADYNYLELGAYALYPNTRFLSARVRQFIDFLKEYFGETPYWDVE
ncbi:MAG: LysR family transcriptional regulator [Sneathiella sp.]